MSSKILLKFLGGCLVLLLVFGLTVQNSEAGVVAVSGNTDEPSGQLLIPFVENDLKVNLVQVTNTSSTTPVNIHVQILDATTANCTECDFFDTLTPNDTVVYEIAGLNTNEDIDTGERGGAPCDTFNGHGVMVITPVLGTNFDESGPIAHNHLHGVVHQYNNSEALGTFDYLFNAVGRDAILASGAKASDGTPLDGSTATLRSIVPNNYNLQYNDQLDDLTGNAGSPNYSDAIFVALTDDFSAGSYSPQPGTSSLYTIDVFDDIENPQSCDEISFSCVDIVGINNQHQTTLVANGAKCVGETPDEGCAVICANESASHPTGFTRLRALSAGTANVNFGILGHAVTNAGGASHIFVK